MSQIQLNLNTSTYLRGIAILAVLAIHVLAGIPGIHRPDFSHWQLFTIIDQLARFCVPLFVALSGFGFWEKYQDKDLKFWSFIKRQGNKLLPLYLLVSVLSYIIFFFIPTWRVVGTPDSFLVQLISGRSDYHLYFVPMIFQFYLLFPFLNSVVKRYRWSSLIVSAIFQLGLYLILSQSVLPEAISKYLGTDQQQYFWFFSWIFYFVLGMHLSSIVSWLKSSRASQYLLLTVTLISSFLLIRDATTHIYLGIDPIIALRFTRPIVLLYTTSVILSLFTFIKASSSRLGSLSYPIYLFHTLILRLIFEIFVYGRI